MVREAFWDVYRPGCMEHLVVHKLKTSPALIKELDFVACDGNKIVGVIICPKSKIKNDKDEEFEVLSMIMGVLPSYQKRGIGSALIKKVIEEARALGFKGVVIFGSPDYYLRFGFKNAKEYGIQTSGGENFDPFMALELSKKSLEGMRGRFYEVLVDFVNDKELELFEKEFSFKEKHITDTQLKI